MIFLYATKFFGNRGDIAISVIAIKFWERSIAMRAKSEMARMMVNSAANRTSSMQTLRLTRGKCSFACVSGHPFSSRLASLLLISVIYSRHTIKQVTESYNHETTLNRHERTYPPQGCRLLSIPTHRRFQIADLKIICNEMLFVSQI